MPNESERRGTLDLLNNLIPMLQIQFDLQQIVTQSEALERAMVWDSDDEEGSDEEDERQELQEMEDSAALAGYATIQDLEDMRVEVAKGRYYMERKTGRNLRALRGPHLERCFHMDKNWFKAEVRTHALVHDTSLTKFSSLAVHPPSFELVMPDSPICIACSKTTRSFEMTPTTRKHQ
jgi:hypothetical protein